MNLALSSKLPKTPHSRLILENKVFKFDLKKPYLL